MDLVYGAEQVLVLDSELQLLSEETEHILVRGEGLNNYEVY